MTSPLERWSEPFEARSPERGEAAPGNRAMSKVTIDRLAKEDRDDGESPFPAANCPGFHASVW